MLGNFVAKDVKVGPGEVKDLGDVVPSGEKPVGGRAVSILGSSGMLIVLARRRSLM